MSKSFWIGSIAIALLSAAAARAADAPEGLRLEVGPVEVQRRVFEFAPKPIKLGDYWLGVECRPVDDALRAQLGLPEDQGLVVENVVPSVLISVCPSAVTVISTVPLGIVSSAIS